ARDGENEIAENTIAYLSLQAVGCLQPYLLRFFLERTPNARTYYANWPWRGATSQDVVQLLGYLRTAPSANDSLRAFRCVLESRNPEYLSAALTSVRPWEFPHSEAVYWAEIGFDGPRRPLFANTVLHLRFPLDFLSKP